MDWDGVGEERWKEKVELYLLLCCHQLLDRKCALSRSSPRNGCRGCPRHRAWTWDRQKDRMRDNRCHDLPREKVTIQILNNSIELLSQWHQKLISLYLLYVKTHVAITPGTCTLLNPSTFPPNSITSQEHEAHRTTCLAGCPVTRCATRWRITSLTFVYELRSDKPGTRAKKNSYNWQQTCVGPTGFQSIGLHLEIVLAKGAWMKKINK